MKFKHLLRLLRLCGCRDKVKVRTQFGPVTMKGFPFMAGVFILTDEQKVSGVVEITTAGGNPAPVESYDWSVSDPEVLELTVSEDKKTVTVAAKKLGTCQLRLKVDADMRPDVVKELLGVQDFEVVAAMAVNVTFKFGTPELKTPPVSA